MLTSILVRGADAQNSTYLNTADCPLARGVNRRLKKGYTCRAYLNEVHIYDVYGYKVFGDVLPKHFTSSDFKNIEKSGKNIIVKVEIPEQYLKRVHKSKLSRAEKQLNQVRQAAFDRPEKVESMRLAAKVLDKIFPKWREVDLTDLNMLSCDDCLLVRIARLHNLNNVSFNSLNNFILGFHDCPAVFNTSTTPHDWALIIAEGKKT